MRVRLLSSLALLAATPALAAVATVSAASYRGGAVAPGSLAASFGGDLASTTAVATATPLPESLGGTTVKITDSAGVERTAQLLFVSPGQVNYLLPEGLAEGAAEIAIQRGEVVQKGPVTIRNAAPGLFTANGDGKGVAAAIALRFAGGNLVNSAPVFRYDLEAAKCLPDPIDMGADSDRIFVSLYGTGLRHAGAVTATILGRAAPVSWSGPNGVYAGLDQVNLEIPRSLLGRGNLTVRLAAGGVEANPVLIELAQSTDLNLDYEGVSSGRIRGWLTGGQGYELAQDESVAYSGSRSLRIRMLQQVAGASGSTSQNFPLVAARGRHFRFTSYIKTQGMTRGQVGLWLWVGDGAERTLSIDNVLLPEAPSEWTLCAIDRDISPNAARIAFGVLQKGDGTAWYDAMAVELDGRRYGQPPSPAAAEPSPAQLDWIRNHAIPVTTPDAGNGFEDLERVRDIVGDARIVGLGEATHGTSEFFRMKHRLLEFLATRMGFTIFAIEASMPEAYRLNDYVLRGEGDPAALLGGLFAIWRTQEVLDMIRWMREFNRSGRGPVQFTGFDMQDPVAAMDNVSRFVAQAEPSYVQTVDAAWSLVRAVHPVPWADRAANPSASQQAAAAAREIWRHLDQNRSAYRGGFTDAAVEWAIQNGRVVEQAMNAPITGSRYRDLCMAANLDWILEQNPGAKAVLWAHNLHVAKGDGMMGYHLDLQHGEDYRALGFAFHEGGYRANNGPNNAVTPSFPGSVEYYFHSTGIPNLILDMRPAGAGDPASSWLLGPIHHRNIGARPEDAYQYTSRLAADYDTLIFFDHTSASAAVTQ